MKHLDNTQNYDIIKVLIQSPLFNFREHQHDQQ